MGKVINIKKTRKGKSTNRQKQMVKPNYKYKISSACKQINNFTRAFVRQLTVKVPQLSYPKYQIYLI